MLNKQSFSMNKKNIIIMGAGQIGSRHLQALKKVKIPLNILVIDSSTESLKLAKARFREVNSINNVHSVGYYEVLPENCPKIDLAIVATSSDHRREVIEKLLKSIEVKYFVLEKLLFNKKEDYKKIKRELVKFNCKAWVNCSMRTMPFYSNLKSSIGTNFIQYQVVGSNLGLATAAIHYIDQIAYLTDCYDFKVDVGGLENIIESKRKGFLEVTGSLMVRFGNGSYGCFTSYFRGNAPVVITISSEKFNCIIKESNNKAWVSDEGTNWEWSEVRAEILPQSVMTTELVERILSEGACILPTYEQSMSLHIPLLDGLLKFVNKHKSPIDKLDYYPFT